MYTYIMIEFLIISLVFFTLGRYSRLFARKDRVEETIDEIVNKAKTIIQHKPKPGVMPFKTEEELEAEKNGDAALDRHWKTSGIGKLVRGEK